MRYDTTSRRFAQGTASIPALYSCREGLRILLEVGQDTIEAEARRRGSWIVERALERGWRVRSPRSSGDRGGAVMIGVDRPRELADSLRRRRVLVDWRPGVGLAKSQSCRTPN